MMLLTPETDKNYFEFFSKYVKVINKYCIYYNPDCQFCIGYRIVSTCES